jgi:hypothetical protein
VIKTYYESTQVINTYGIQETIVEIKNREVMFCSGYEKIGDLSYSVIFSNSSMREEMFGSG